jgi:tetratricopeptide (TPR) repeat protein
MILKEEGKVTEAVAVIKKSIKKKNDQVPFYLLLSSFYDETGDNASSEAILQDGLKVLPRSTDLHYALGVLYDKTNRFEESIMSMKKILDIDPKNAEALNFIGYSYAVRDMHLDEAEAMILRALKIKPGNGYLLDSLGWVYFKKNDLKNAEKYLKEAWTLLPDEIEIIEHLGDLYVRQNRLKDAADMYERGMKIDPGNDVLKKKREDIRGTR